MKSRTIVNADSVEARRVGREVMLAVKGDPTARNEAAMRAACLLLVTKGWRACSSPREVNRLMPEGEWFRSAAELRKATGGRKAVIRRVAVGGVIPPGSLGAWSPDFWHGLSRSGAFVAMPMAGKRFVRRSVTRPWLLPAIQGDVPFVRSWARCRDGTMFWGMWAAGMGADDPWGVGVLAGLLAGGRRVEVRGEGWLGFAWRPENAVLLERHLVPSVRMGRPGNGTILVSPFWGAVLAGEMPGPIGDCFLGWGGRRAMCPLLPWAFMAYAWGEWPGDSGDDYARGMVPWAVSKAMMHKSGFKVGRQGLRRLAFERLGMRGVSAGVRAAWLRGLAARGVTEADFPVGKVPLDFRGHSCHDVGGQGEEGQT